MPIAALPHAHVAMFGRSGSGMRSLLIRYSENRFPTDDELKPDIVEGIVRVKTFEPNPKRSSRHKDIDSIYVTLSHGRSVEVTASFKPISACIVVISMETPKSLRKVKTLLQQIWVKFGKPIPLALVQTKFDIYSTDPGITNRCTSDDVKAFCRELGVRLYQMSAKTNENSQAGMNEILKYLLRKSIENLPVQGNTAVKAKEFVGTKSEKLQKKRASRK